MAAGDDVGASHATTTSRTGQPATRYASDAGPEAGAGEVGAAAGLLGAAAGPVDAGEVGVFAMLAASVLPGRQPLTISAESASSYDRRCVSPRLLSRVGDNKSLTSG